MPQTAVGLFENPELADEVVRDLAANGFREKDVQILSEPTEIAFDGPASTPRTDFEVDLTRDLRAVGVGKEDADAYVEGVRRGAVIVFVTGFRDKAEKAAEIMNEHGAVEIEKISASRLELPSEAEQLPARDPSIQTGRVRSNGSGARLFVW
jgi:hypothetical protein